MSICIAGGTGNVGQYVAAACLSTPFRGSFREVKLLTRNPNSSAARELAHAGAEALVADLQGASTNISVLAALLQDVDVLIDCQSGGEAGHRNKDALLAAAREAGVRNVILSEFGIDHRQIDFEHPEWDEKKAREQKARQAGNMHVISFYNGLFLEDSFGPWFGFDSDKGVWESVGSPSTPFSLTSKVDVGLSIASLASHCIRGVGSPTHLRIAGQTTTVSHAADVFSSARHRHGLIGKILDKIEHEPEPATPSIRITSVDLETFKKQTLAAKGSDPAPYLRFIMGEGKLDHSRDSANEVVNPGEQAWKWTTLEEYAKSVKGRPWCSDTQKDIRTPLQQVRDKLAIPATTHSAITADIGQSQAQTSQRHPEVFDVQKTSLP